MSFLADKLPRVNLACVTHTGDVGAYRSVGEAETIDPVNIVLDDLSSELPGEFAFERATSCMIQVSELPWAPAQDDEVSLLGKTWLVDAWQIEHEMYLFELRAYIAPEGPAFTNAYSSAFNAQPVAV